MIMTVTWAGIGKGEFDNDKKEHVSYNNVKIYALKPKNYEKGESFGFGKVPVEIKIKNDPDLLTSIFGFVPTKDDLKAMYMQDYNITFDDSKNVDCIMPAPALAPAAAQKGA